jgi:hypothetical protein
MSGEILTLVSDAHFGSGADEAERRRSFVRFLASLHGTSRLVVAGDLFQFWFDLGRTMPKGYFDVLAACILWRSGTRIDYLAGNHDYWRSRSSTTSSASRPTPALEVHGQGGACSSARDGAGPGDRLQAAPPEVHSRRSSSAPPAPAPGPLQAVARVAGSMSRTYTNQRPPDLARLEAVARSGFERGADAVVLGHVHTQLHRQMAGGELVVIGDWLELRSYVQLESGRLRLGRFTEPR